MFLIRFLNIQPKPTVTRNQKAALSDVVVHERWARFLKHILRIMFDHSSLVKCPLAFFGPTLRENSGYATDTKVSYYTAALKSERIHRILPV